MRARWGRLAAFGPVPTGASNEEEGRVYVKRFLSAVIACSLAFSFAGTPALAQAPKTPAKASPAGKLPEGVTFVTSVEGIDEYRLDNGLRVLFFPDSSKQTATVNITY